MKEIPLTRGKVVLVDDEDYAELSKHQWYDYTRRNGVVHARRVTRKDSFGMRYTVCMAREIMKATVKERVHHINGDSLDNQKSNLQLCVRYPHKEDN